MPLPTNVQHVSAATSAASPASIAPVLAATVAGNLLCAFVAQPGNVTITPPANWKTELVVNNANITGYLFSLAGNLNAGGITTVTFTLGGSNAGAIASVQEWSNLNKITPFPFTATSGNNAGSTGVSSGALSPIATNMLWFGGIAWITGQTLTPANLPAGVFTNLDAQQTSTTAATNITGFCYSGTPGALLPNPFAGTLAGTLGGSAAWVSLLKTAVSTSSAQAHNVLDGSITGLLVGEGAGYAIGV